MPIILSLSDEEVSDGSRRLSLFSGDVFVYSPRRSTSALCHPAQGILERLLGPDAITAQQRMAEQEFASQFARAARELSDVADELVSAVVADFQCDPETTYIGATTLCASTGLGFLAHGLGIPQHPHRDTWYAAAPCQLNWWIPLFDLESSMAFAFYPRYWDTPVTNNSAEFRYDEWEEDWQWEARSRAEERLSHPRPLEPIELRPEIRICCPAGGVIISSVAQLYSTVPNETSKTHFSVHFQTVSSRDLESDTGASNVDAHPAGTPLASFVRCSDLSPMPEQLLALSGQRWAMPTP